MPVSQKTTPVKAAPATIAKRAAAHKATPSPFDWKKTPNQVELPDDSGRSDIQRATAANRAAKAQAAVKAATGQSLIGKDLQRSAARGGGAFQLAPRTFHVYSKAKP